jgi:hypothetical protein
MTESVPHQNRAKQQNVGSEDPRVAQTSDVTRSHLCSSNATAGAQEYRQRFDSHLADLMDHRQSVRWVLPYYCPVTVVAGDGFDRRMMAVVVCEPELIQAGAAR